MRIDGPQITGSINLNGDSVGDFDSLITTSSFYEMTASMATTGSNTFVGTQTVSGSIIPSVNDTYDLGSPTHQFRHVYISSGSLYIDGTKVLGSTSQELQITTDGGQSFKILEAGSDTITLQSADGNITLASSGGGDVILDPTNGIVALKGTVTIYNGNKIVSSDGNAIHIGDDIVVSGSILSTGTDLVSGSSQIVFNELSGLPSNIISGSEQLSTLGIATTGSNTFNGDLTVNGYLDVQELRTTFISSSILYRSGSTKFGDESSDVHTFTGSLNVFGALGNNPVTLQGDSVSNSWLRLKSGLTNTTFQIGAVTGSFIIYDEVNNTNRFVVDPNGDIAVGVDSPTVYGSGMEIKTGTQTGLRLSSTSVGGGAIEIGADNTQGYIQSVSLGDKINFFVSNTTATDTLALTIASNGKIGVGETDPDNTYQGITIKGNDPSLRLKTTSSSGWTWVEYADNAGTNTWSMGVNHTTSYFGIKSGAGMDTPNFKMNTGGLIEITRTTPMTTQSNYDYKNIIVKTGFGSGYVASTIQSLLSGYDSTIHGVDIGYSYDGGGVGNVGYSLRFSTNDDLTGNPIERLRINSIGTSTFYGGVRVSGLSIGVDPTANVLDIRGENNTYDGTIILGARGTIQHRDAGQTIFSIANDYNSDLAKMEFRMKGNTSANSKLTILGSGDATFTNTVYVKGDIVIGDYTTNTTLWFRAVNNGASRINFYDQNNTEGTYIRSIGETHGGQIRFGARWDDDEDKVIFRMYQTSAGAAYNARFGLNVDPTETFHVSSDGITASAPSKGWPNFEAENDTNARKFIFQTGGNNLTATAGYGGSVVLQMGQYYDSRVIITPIGAGGASPSDQGTGYGKDLMLKAGTSDNTNGAYGGRLYLNGGMGFASNNFSANGGNVLIQSLPGSGNVGINDTNPQTKLSINGANYIEMATFAITPTSSAEIVANNTGALNFSTRHNSNSSVFSITTGGIQILKAGIVHVSFAQDIITTAATGYVAMYIRKNGTSISENLITNTNGQWDMLTGVATTSVSANDVISFFITNGADVTSIDAATWSQYSFIWASR